MTRYPLAPRQRRMWLAQQLRGQDAVYQITVAFTLRGELDPEALERAVRELAQRHPALRTRIDATGDVPEQVVMADWSAFAVGDLTKLSGNEAMQAERNEIDAASRSGIDLTAEAALRVRLLRISKERHLLLVCVHHMMADMVSMDIIGRDLTEFYNALVEHREPRLPVLRITYGEHAQAENAIAELPTEEQRPSIDHWASILDGAPTRLMLPWAGYRSQANRGDTAVEGLTCARRTLTGLRNCASLNKATLFTVLLAAFHCYLHRITDQEVTNVGTFVAVRHRSELEDLVGLLFDEVPVVVHMGPQRTFADVLASVRGQLADALQYTGNGVADAARKVSGRATPTAPPFNITMQMYQRSPGRLAFNGLVAEQHRVFVGSKYDLMLYAAVSQTGLDLWFNYDTALFDQETVRRLLRGLNHLLGQLDPRADVLVDDLEIVPPGERAQLMQAALGPVTRYPNNTDIDTLFRAIAKANPGRTAVRWAAARGGKSALTYAELDVRAQNVADRLAEAGVGQSDVVGVLAERDGWLVPAYLGVLRVGAAVLLIDTDTPTDFIRAALAETGATSVLADVMAQQRHQLDRVHCLALDEALNARPRRPRFQPEPLDAESPAFLVRTSGTTGPSKAVVLGHRGLINQVFHRRAIFDVDPGSIIALSLSVAFSALPMQLLVPLLSGATLVVCDARTVRSPEAIIKYADDEGVTILELTPSLLGSLLASGSRTTPHRLRFLITAGEKLSRRLANDLVRRFPGTTVVTTWGQSEASGIMCSGVVTEDFEHADVSEGLPSANNRVYVLDERMRPVPFGVEGMAYFAGPSVALGRIGSALDSEVFGVDPWVPHERMVQTGDRAVRRPDGSVVVRGRLDAVVKVRGNRVNLGDITTALREHPRVLDAHVIAQRSPGDIELWAYVQSDPGLRQSDVVDFLRQRLPDFMRPQLQMVVEPFPRTANGKIDVSRLPLVAPKPPAKDSGDRLERLTSWEQQVARAWEHILGVTVDGDSDFFLAGGHSLKAMTLCAAVSNMSGAPVSVMLIFEHPVLRDFAAAVAPISVVGHGGGGDA